MLKRGLRSPMRRSSLEAFVRAMYGTGFQQVGPAVSSVSSATQAEGTSLVHTVTLASAVSGTPGKYAFNLTAGTASTPSDYTATPTFSNSVTLSGGVLTVPIAVTTFTITVSTTDDAVYEGSEAYSVTVGNVTNTGTITDNESAPTIASVSSASATEGSNIVHTVAVTGVAQAARTFALAFSGAAVAGTDYNSTPTFSAGVTLSGGNITVPAGVTSFTVTVATINNASLDGSRAYTLSIGTASGTGSISDDDAPSPAFAATLTALTNATGTVTTLAYINPGSGSTLTLSVDESVASGVAPLAVFFDATTSTSTQTTRPFHDVGYWSDFGDTGAGTWSYGNGANTSRNAANGPVSAHVYETAGTYTFTQYGYDGVSTTTTTKTITVTDPDTVWASTTACISTTSDTTGAPAGATLVTNFSGNIQTEIATQLAAGKRRILLHRGQTFTLSALCTIAVAGPGLLGAFGSGAKPIIQSSIGTANSGMFRISTSATPTTVYDWRFQDLTISGISGAIGIANASTAFYGDGSFSKVLLNRVDMQNVYYGINLSNSLIDSYNGAVPYTHAMWDQFFVVDSSVYNLTPGNGPNSMFLSATRAAVMGCNIDNNGGGEHGIRFQLLNRGVIDHNTVQNTASGKTNMTVRGVLWTGTNTMPAGTYSEKVVISNNKLVGGVGIGPQNDTTDERGRNILFERNWSVLDPTKSIVSTINQSDVTVRNNICHITGNVTGYAFEVKPEDTNAVNIPTRVNFYNNTLYHAGTAADFGLMQVTSNNGSLLNGSVFDVKNNLVYLPNITTKFVAQNSVYATSTITQGNNTPAPSLATSPAFTTQPPVVLADYTPGSGSYANGAGTNAKVWKDLYGTSTQATPDMGAVVI